MLVATLLHMGQPPWWGAGQSPVPMAQRLPPASREGQVGQMSVLGVLPPSPLGGTPLIREGRERQVLGQLLSGRGTAGACVWVGNIIRPRMG